MDNSSNNNNNSSNSNSRLSSLFLKYNRNRPDKTLPVLKTDKDLEAEGLARLSIDLPGPQATDEDGHTRALGSSPSTSEIAHAFASRAECAGSSTLHRTKLDDHGGFANRHSVGFDVPGAVHTIITPKLKTERQIDSKLVVVMVGLPARGKSYIVKKLRRYLNWLQYETKVFNVGNLRRVKASHQSDQSADFFNPDNKDGNKIRDELAMMVLDQLIDWLQSGGRVAIHDATNSTVQRRKVLIERLQQEPDIKVLILESVCTDKRVLERNFRLKLSGPDYKDKDAAEALSDFRHRVANYERAYEPVGDWEEDHDIQYCKLVNVGKKVIAYNISGYLSGQCIFYLMNFNLAERQIFVTRHGESEDNLTGRIGGDASLSAKGLRFSKALARFVKDRRITFALDLARRKIQEEKESKDPLKDSDDEDQETEHEEHKTEKKVRATAEAISNSQFTIWTSMLKRSMETAQSFDPDEYDIKHIRFLNEINSGSREGMTYEEIKAQFPNEFKARQENKLYYRYPGMGGESYIDVIHRLQSMIIELERMSQSCLIITHRVVLRILLSYLLEWSQTDTPHMLVPIHTVYELRPKPYGVELTTWCYDDDADDFKELKEDGAQE
ncbi:6-phosphofructo-2-kinase-domain-containing protein [Parasitella parasitica]|nr:6-phosphofructo-2-kinase-domain-containing protein [Parasitella parasitica]